MLPRESDHHTSDQHTTNGGAVSLVLPVMPPGTPPPSHLSAKWLESATVTIADAGYTAVLTGGPAPGVKLIKQDFPMLRLKPPDPSSPNYNREVEMFYKHAEANRVAAVQRAHLTMTARTKIATGLIKCCEKNAPELSRDIRLYCVVHDASGAKTDYLDGPRAWLYIITNHLIDPDGRGEDDIQIYDAGLRLIVDNRLPDHCPASDFYKRAYQFIHVIMPNLQRQFSNLQATGTRPRNTRATSTASCTRCGSCAAPESSRSSTSRPTRTRPTCSPRSSRANPSRSTAARCSTSPQ